MTEELRPMEPGLMDLLKGLAGGSWDLDLSPLIDRPLKDVEIRDEGQELIFTFLDGGFVTYGVDGDCCSHSWIEYLTVPPDVEGQIVTHYAENPMGMFETDDWSTTKVYQTSFRTAKGDIVVEYRNSSNGYYGGWLHGPVKVDLGSLA